MLGKQYTYQQTIQELREREKELKCIYRVEETINQKLPLDQFFHELLKRIPSGWQYQEICRVKITFEEVVYKELQWNETEWSQQADIIIDDLVLGMIEVYYTAFRKLVVDTPFLPQEQKLLNTIAARISDYIFDMRLVNTIHVLQQEIEENEKEPVHILSGTSSIHWQWRLEMSKLIAAKLDFDRFGVKALYLIGSTKTADAGPASDIDLMIHVRREPTQELKAWLEGWSLCLSEMNYQKTGFKTNGLLDIHFITDRDIEEKTSYAIMIGSHHNRALPLKVL